MTEEQKQLVMNNHKLIYSFLQKYNLNVEEYYDLAAIGLCRAAKSYKNDISKFATYAYRCMFNMICNEFKKKKYVSRIPDELIVSYNKEIINENGENIEFLECIPSDVDMEECVLLEVDIRKSLNKLNLSERDRLIFELLIDGYNSSEIGQIVNCDRNTVARVRRKIAKKLDMIWKGDY